jgi:Flp pilus assembly protein TadG
MITKHTRAGATLIWVTVAFSTMIAFASLAVDYGRVQVAKTELLQAADAAARAAAGSLPSGTTAARNEAVRIAALNKAAGLFITLDPNADVDFGFWGPPDTDFAETDDWTAMDWSTAGDEDMADDGTWVFTPLAAADISMANAVRVTARCAASRGTAVPLLFAKAIGMNTCDVSSLAIAAIHNYGPGDGIVGLKEIDMKKQSGTDSYDSRIGNYGGGNVRSNGNIASNGKVRIHDSATIKGNIAYGKNKAKDIDSKVIVTGSVGPISPPVTFKPINVGNAASVNSNGSVASGLMNNDLNLHLDNNDNITLPGGTYYFHDLHLDDKAVLNFSGPVVIYLTGNGEISGQIKTYQNLPKNLQINVVSNKTFNFKSNDNYYMSLYAPKARVKIDHSGDLFGAVLAKSLKIGNQVHVHYDESLRGSGGGLVVETVK